VKYLRYSLHDLHELFTRSITVRHIAEPFVSFDGSRSATEVKTFMDAKDFDVVGVRHDGLVVGFVQRQDLKNGCLDDHMLKFEPAFLLEDCAPIINALDLLTTSPHVLVLAMAQIAGIITKGDLQKAPIRMWLFGLISLLETQLLRIIRAVYPANSWTNVVSDGRLNNARELYEDRKRRNEEIDLADCLQFADKRTIVSKTARLRSALGFDSRGAAEQALKAFEHLRDELAHAQDIVTGRWPALAGLSLSAEELVRRCEDFEQ
jgi:hypothetical protein